MNKMFDSNINLVYKVFHEKIESHVVNHSMKDDLIQIGMLALWKCCLHFNPDLGVQFSTYAYTAIRKSMMCAVVRENKKTAVLVSLEKPIQENAEEGEITYEDTISCGVDIAKEVELNSVTEDISRGISGDAEMVINMVRQGHTQLDIAKELNMTRSRVGKIVKKFRKELKNTLLFDE